MLFNIPLTIAPLIVYNLVGAGLIGGQNLGVWNDHVATINMVSGGVFVLEFGHLMIIAGLVCLFIEIIKATRNTSPSIYDHGFSLVVFILYLVEFITVGFAASAIFFILMLMSLIDVVAGFTISIRSARRDFAIERDA